MRLLPEALRSAIAQPVTTAVTSLIVAGVCAVILSTTGQTVIAEQEVLSRIDDAGTRSIIINDAVGDAGITADSIARLGRVAGVEWVIGLGPATDVRAIGIPGGNLAAVRTLYGAVPPQIAMIGLRDPLRTEVLAGQSAQRSLGLQHPYGGVKGPSEFALVGGLRASEPLAFLNHSLIRLTELDKGNLRSIHILVKTPAQVDSVTNAALMLVGSANPSSIAVETSQTLADVRSAVAGELGEFSRRLIALVLGAGLALTTIAVYGAISSRKRDFGRRRALGAGRLTIIVLVTLQTCMAAILGAVLGSGMTTLLQVQANGSSPDAAFVVSIITLATMTAVVAAIPPALLAAFRDPVRALRVP